VFVCVLCFQAEHNDAYSVWSLTEDGLASLCTGSRLRAGRMVKDPRPDVDLDKKTVWELYVELVGAGWTLSAVTSSKHQKQLIPYTVGANQIMYCGDRGLTSRNYLACLQTAGAGHLVGIPIEHFKPDIFYGDLLAGRNPLLREPKQRRHKGRQVGRNKHGQSTLKCGMGGDRHRSVESWARRVPILSRSKALLELVVRREPLIWEDDLFKDAPPILDAEPIPGRSRRRAALAGDDVDVVGDPICDDEHRERPGGSITLVC
jgi:hypothetical protein